MRYPVTDQFLIPLQSQDLGLRKPLPRQKSRQQTTLTYLMRNINHENGWYIPPFLFQLLEKGNQEISWIVPTYCVTPEVKSTISGGRLTPQHETTLLPLCFHVIRFQIPSPWFLNA